MNHIACEQYFAAVEDRKNLQTQSKVRVQNEFQKCLKTEKIGIRKF